MIKDEKFIEMNELSAILKSKNIKVATNWCKENEIPIFVVGNKKLVYRFLVNAGLDKQIISFFKERYPESWDKLYNCYLRDESLEFIMTLETKMLKYEQLELSPKSDFAKSFLEDH